MYFIPKKMNIKWCYLVLAALLLMLLPAQGVLAFQNETLHYVVQYKWGLVHKDAGEATLSLRNQGDRYMVTLTGRTKTWADKFFCVRDTLKSTIRKHGLQPLYYAKLTHEGGKYSRDIINYKYVGNNVVATTDRMREKKGKVTKSRMSFSAQAPAYDMLSIFYYLRNIDYDKLRKGSSFRVTMFSGSKKELMTFTCVCKETLKLRDKSRREAYKLKFNFREGSKKSSDDVLVWISTDSRHIPLQVVGNLKVGQVRCFYTGG